MKICNLEIIDMPNYGATPQPPYWDTAACLNCRYNDLKHEKASTSGVMSAGFSSWPASGKSKSQ